MAHGKMWMVNERKCWPMCEPCAKAREDYLKAQRLRRGLRRTDKRIDVTRTRERLIQLRDVHHIPATEIAANVGMTDIQIGRIIRGRSSVVYTSKARRILIYHTQVTTSPQPERVHWNPDLVDSELTRIALRGLAAQGWNREWIKKKTGLHLKTISEITQDLSEPHARARVAKTTEAKVLALVKEVGSTSGPSKYAQTVARNRGWQPTMYCDALV